MMFPMVLKCSQLGSTVVYPREDSTKEKFDIEGIWKTRFMRDLALLKVDGEEQMQTRQPTSELQSGYFTQNIGIFMPIQRFPMIL